MGNQNDQQWEQLKQYVPSNNQKEKIRSRIRQSIQYPSQRRTPIIFPYWQSTITTCLLLLICGGLLWALLYDERSNIRANQSSVVLENVSWDLKDVYGKKTRDGYELYRKNKSLPIGSYSEVTKDEMLMETQTSAMFVQEELKHFPYPTQMYIEHKKQENVSLRYHFFIPYHKEEKWIHLTFDYQQVEFAEIFQAIATLTINGKNPYIHDQPLYVKHGYGDLIYPVGIEPVSISSLNETYLWENPQLQHYLEKVEAQGWKKISTGSENDTFSSPDGYQEVTISLKGKELTYEFIYHHQEN